MRVGIEIDDGVRQVAVLSHRPMSRMLFRHAVEADGRFRIAVTGSSATDLPPRAELPLDAIAVVADAPGLDLAAQVTESTARQHRAGVVVVVPFVDHHVIDCLRSAGATAVLSTSHDLEDLYACLDGRDLAEHTPIERSRTDHLLTRHGITTREFEILHHLADGLTPQQIALELGIRLPTARDHLAALRKKLDCTTAVQLVVRAYRLGLAPHVGRLPD